MSKTATEYWSEHTVTTGLFKSKEQALKHFNWRNAQYIDYLSLMPVTGQAGKVVLDYGCGPGNDVMGFATFSSPERLIAMDISAPALNIAEQNLALFGKKAEFYRINEFDNSLPLEDKSVDYIHTSGVLHHCSDLSTILQEFYRVLKNDGEIAVMVYNYDSLWLHLYTAWMQPVLNKKFIGMSLEDAFRANTDGESCPISKCYKPDEFINLMSSSRFDCEFVGASVSMHEMKVARYRYLAIEDRELAHEHRAFLSELHFDERQIPHYQGRVAGIDGCYRLRKKLPKF